MALAAMTLMATVPEVGAQSMTPMRGVITSFSDEFALKVYPRNVYPHRILMEVRTYDRDFRPVRAMVWPDRFWLGPNSAKPVTVVIPFDGTNERRVRVCAESVPLAQTRNQVRVRICGKFLARRSQ